MAESNLTTTVFCEQSGDATELLAAEESIPTTPSAPTSRGWERLTSRLSLVIGAALAASLIMLAIGYAAAARDRVSARAKHSTHPIDWWLWFGGAKKDQTFKKFVKDSAAKSQREWDEKYRNSPAHQVDPKQANFSDMKWKFEPARPLTQPAQRAATRTRGGP